jgi:uncharacterized protein (DUF305 family)
MKKITKTGVVGLGLAFMLGAAFAADPMTKDLEKTSGKEFDQRFLSHMLQHHQQGLEMAKLAAARAQQPGLKRQAENTARMQEKDIKEMKTMLGEKVSSHATSESGHSSAHGQTSGQAATSHSAAAPATSHKSGSMHGASGSHAAMPGMHESMKDTMMSRLQSASGAEFDRVFVEQMTKHHRMGAEMAQLAGKRASSDEVKEFAEKAAKEQEHDIDQLKRYQTMATE